MKKEVAQAVRFAEERGFAVLPRKGKGHVVAILRCAYGCCQISVNGTPRNPGNHAKMIRSRVLKCVGGAADDNDAEEDDDERNL